MSGRIRKQKWVHHLFGATSPQESKAVGLGNENLKATKTCGSESSPVADVAPTFLSLSLPPKNRTSSQDFKDWRFNFLSHPNPTNETRANSREEQVPWREQSRENDGDDERPCHQALRQEDILVVQRRVAGSLRRRRGFFRPEFGGRRWRFREGTFVGYGDCLFLRTPKRLMGHSVSLSLSAFLYLGVMLCLWMIPWIYLKSWKLFAIFSFFLTVVCKLVLIWSLKLEA